MAASNNLVVNSNLAAWHSNSSMDTADISSLEVKPLAYINLEASSNLVAINNLAQTTSLGVTFDG